MRPFSAPAITLITGAACTMGGGSPDETGTPEPVEMPIVTEIDPDYGPPGSDVILSGEGFGLGVEVTFGGDAVDVLDAADGVVTVRIPRGAGSSSFHVVQDGVQSNPVPFVVSELQVTQASPSVYTRDPSGAIYPTDRVLAQFDSLSRAAAEGMVGVDGFEIIGWIPSISFAQVGLPDGMSPADAMNVLPSLGATRVVLEYAGMNEGAGRTDLELLRADDSHHANEFDYVRVQEAWDWIDEQVDAGVLELHPVRVGIVESRIDHEHEELAAYFSRRRAENPGVSGLSLWGERRNFFHREDHGTMVTSVVAGLQNGEGTQGLLTGVVHEGSWVIVRGEPKARVDEMQQDIVDALGDEAALATLFEELAGVEFLASMTDVSVVNLSFGLQVAGAQTHDGRPFPCTRPTVPAEAMPIVQDAYRLIFAAHPDVLFVASAGNTSIRATDHAPGGTLGVPNLITVGAVNADGKQVSPDQVAGVRWFGSDKDSCGKSVVVGSAFGDGVDLVAPGSSVLVPNPKEGDEAWRARDGTSFAAPFVTGTAALAAAIDPKRKGAALKALLVNTAVALTEEQDTVELSDGTTDRVSASGARLDVRNAVEHAHWAAEGASPDTPDDGSVNGVTFGGLSHGMATIRFNVSLTDLAGEPVNRGLRAEDFAVRNMRVKLTEHPDFEVAVRSSQVVGIDFGREADRVVVPIDIDQSGSMLNNDPEGLRFEATKVLADRLLEGGGTLNRAALASFPRDVQLGDGFTDTVLWQDFASRPKDLEDAVDKMPTDIESNFTPLWDSIVELAEYTGTVMLDQPATSVPAMIVMTDGVDTLSTSTSADARVALEEHDIQLFVVGLGTNLDFDALLDVSVATSGTFVVANDAADLSPLFASMAQAVTGSVNLEAMADLEPEGGTWVTNALYEFSGQLVYSVPGSPGAEVVMGFRFDAWIGNL